MNYCDPTQAQVNACLAGFRTWFYVENMINPMDSRFVENLMENYPNVFYRAMRNALNEINLRTNRTPAGILWKDTQKKLELAILNGDEYHEKTLGDLLALIETEYHHEVREEQALWNGPTLSDEHENSE